MEVRSLPALILSTGRRRPSFKSSRAEGWCLFERCPLNDVSYMPNQPTAGNGVFRRQVKGPAVSRPGGLALEAGSDEIRVGMGWGSIFELVGSYSSAVQPHINNGYWVWTILAILYSWGCQIAGFIRGMLTVPTELLATPESHLCSLEIITSARAYHFLPLVPQPPPTPPSSPASLHPPHLSHSPGNPGSKSLLT